MDRRKFVKTLGTSAIPSTWILASDEIMGRMNRTSLSEAEKSAPQGVSQASDIWPRPTLVPLPTEVAGASQPITGLDGTWKVTTTPPAEFWANGVDPSGWTDITVPGELTAQGIQFARDNEFAYKRPWEFPPRQQARTFC